jgi:hypothetical protein
LEVSHLLQSYERDEATPKEPVQLSLSLLFFRDEIEIDGMIGQ